MEQDDLSGVHLMFSFHNEEEGIIFNDLRISTDVSDKSLYLDLNSVKLRNGDGLLVSISMKDLYEAIARALPEIME